MPSFRRKAVEPDPPPPEDSITDPNAEVFQIRFTGEIFTNYEDYFKRYNYYRKPIFACEKTGKLNLTFEEALSSEKEARRRVQEKFPEVWRLPAMEKIHYNTHKLNQLVDELYDFFRLNIFPGEIVTVDTEHDSQLARVIEQVPAPEEKATDTASPIVLDTSEDDATNYFHVELIDEDLEPVMEDEGDDTESETSDESRKVKSLVLPAFHLKRDRQVLSKQNFKKFVREVATKDVWIGAPWIIRPELIQRYGLANEPPKEIAKLYAQRAEPKQKSPKKKKGKPAAAEDSDMEDEEGTEEGKGGKGKKGGKRKGKKTKQGKEEDDENADGKGKSRGKDKQPRKARAKKMVLKFPMEDTEMHKLAPPRTELDDGRPVPDRPNPSYDFGDVPEELRCVLLQVYEFLNMFGKPLQLYPFTLDDFIKALGHRTSQHEVTLLSEAFGSLIAICCREWSQRVQDNVSLPNPMAGDRVHISYSPEAETLAEECTRLFESLKEEEGVAVDQWWKWYPGRWASGYEVKKGSFTNLLGSRTGPDVGRMKAWQVALLGILKYWVPADRMPRKWNIMKQLLTGEREQESEAELDQTDTRNGHVNGGAGSEEDTGMDVDVEDANEYHSESSEDEITKEYPSRSKRRKIVVDDDEDDDYKPAASEEPKGRSTRHSRVSSSGTPPIKSRSRAGTKANSISNATIDRICRAAECGFGELDSADRLDLLWFMIDECVSVSVPVRGYLDECHDRVTELKKEKKAVLKERRDMQYARMELDKRDREYNVEEEKEAEENGDDQVHHDDGEDADSLDDPMHTDISTPLASDSDTDDGRRRRNSINTHRHKSRVQKLREEQLRREAQEQRRKEEAEKLRKEHKERQKELRQRAEERKRIEDTENALLRREVNIDFQINVLSGRSRLRELGTDRYHNRYWFFDEAMGAVSAQMQASGISNGLGGVGDGGATTTSGKGYKGKGRGGANAFEWFCGRIFVEEIEQREEDADIDEAMGDWGDERIHAGGREITGRWGCYTEPEQYEQLVDWLDPRGIREEDLKEAFENISDIIMQGMQKRNETVQQDMMAILARHENAATRRTRTRGRGSGIGRVEEEGMWDPYMDYVNRWAK